MNPYQNITIALMQVLEAVYKKEAVIDVEDYNIYLINSRVGDKIEVTPITLESESPIHHFANENFFSLERLKSENIGNNRFFTGYEPEYNRNNLSEITGTIAEKTGTLAEKIGAVEDKTGKLADKNQKIIAENKANLKPFAYKYSGETKVISKEIENFTGKIIKKTDKEKTILKTIADFKEAEQHAKKDEIFQLKKIHKKLNTRLKKQGQRIEQNIEIQKSNSRKQKRKTIIYTGLISLIIIFTISFFAKRAFKVNEIKGKTEQVVKYYSPTQIDSLITIFCNSKDTSLTQWRKNHIKSNLQGVKTNDKGIKEKINEFAIYK